MTEKPKIVCDVKHSPCEGFSVCPKLPLPEPKITEKKPLDFSELVATEPSCHMEEASPRKVEGKHIYFWHDERNDKPKTQVWNVFSKEDTDWLGQVSWFPQWRKYAFRSTYHAEGEQHGRFLSDVWFEEKCQRDIADFCEKLTRQHKGKLQ